MPPKFPLWLASCRLTLAPDKKDATLHKYRGDSDDRKSVEINEEDDREAKDERTDVVSIIRFLCHPTQSND